VSTRDRDLRLIFGAVLMYLAVFIIPGIWGFVVGGLALVLFATAALSFCPIYALFGFSTIPAPDKAKRE
jgi:hypothetical protein